MDLGIRGRKALVCGGSKGLGKACARTLAEEGVRVTITARGAKDLAATAAEISEKTGTSVGWIASDMSSEADRRRLVDECAGIDILVTNSGGPPPGDFRDWSNADWHAAIEANMLAPIDMIRLVIDAMIEQQFGRIINITSGAVRAPLPALGLSNGARSGLTGFVAGLSREVIRHNVTINNLLPTAFATERLEVTARAIAEKNGLSPEVAMADRIAGIPAGRFGDPADFGAACAFLCSTKTSYVTGMNFLMDGGSFGGVI
jgi:3-oxoacyl-[acyl-carrier protein] reductase